MVAPRRRLRRCRRVPPHEEMCRRGSSRSAAGQRFIVRVQHCAVSWIVVAIVHVGVVVTVVSHAHAAASSSSSVKIRSLPPPLVLGGDVLPRGVGWLSFVRGGDGNDGASAALDSPDEAGARRPIRKKRKKKKGQVKNATEGQGGPSRLSSDDEVGSTPALSSGSDRLRTKAKRTKKASRQATGSEGHRGGAVASNDHQAVSKGQRREHHHHHHRRRRRSTRQARASWGRPSSTTPKSKDKQQFASPVAHRKATKKRKRRKEGAVVTSELAQELGRVATTTTRPDEDEAGGSVATVNAEDGGEARDVPLSMTTTKTTTRSAVPKTKKTKKTKTRSHAKPSVGASATVEVQESLSLSVTIAAEAATTTTTIASENANDLPDATDLVGLNSQANDADDQRVAGDEPVVADDGHLFEGDGVDGGSGEARHVGDDSRDGGGAEVAEIEPIAKDPTAVEDEDDGAPDAGAVEAHSQEEHLQAHYAAQPSGRVSDDEPSAADGTTVVAATFDGQQHEYPYDVVDGTVRSDENLLKPQETLLQDPVDRADDGHVEPGEGEASDLPSPATEDPPAVTADNMDTIDAAERPELYDPTPHADVSELSTSFVSGLAGSGDDFILDDAALPSLSKDEVPIVSSPDDADGAAVTTNVDIEAPPSEPGHDETSDSDRAEADVAPEYLSNVLPTETIGDAAARTADLEGGTETRVDRAEDDGFDVSAVVDAVLSNETMLSASQSLEPVVATPVMGSVDEVTSPPSEVHGEADTNSVDNEAFGDASGGEKGEAADDDDDDDDDNSSSSDGSRSAFVDSTAGDSDIQGTPSFGTMGDDSRDEEAIETADATNPVPEDFGPTGVERGEKDTESSDSDSEPRHQSIMEESKTSEALQYFTISSNASKVSGKTEVTMSDHEDDENAATANPTIEDTDATTISGVTEVEESELKLDSNVALLESKFAEFDRDAISRATDNDSDLRVSVVTWNLAEESPSEDDATFIRKFRSSKSKSLPGSDFVLIAGQECENIKPRRTEGHRSREFRRLMIKMLGKQFVPIAMHQLGGIQLGLFCKQELISDLEHVSVADVTCGIGNVFHNKGAIGAFVQLKAHNPSSSTGATTPRRTKSLRLLFITAHMAAHVKNTEARDADFWRIATELEAQAPPEFLSHLHSSDPTNRATSETGAGSSKLIDAVDRVFFCGDLNYRIDVPREEAEHSLVKMNELLDAGSTSDAEAIRLGLLRHDQLLRSMSEQRAFPGLAEGKISFSPTFKYDKSFADYDTSHKQRIPAWTDRVLFKPDGVRVLEYTSVPEARHSDHRPVLATFRVNRFGRVLTGSEARRRLKSAQSQSRRNRGSGSELGVQ